MLNGSTDADDIYALQLQIAKAYCEGLKNLIQAPGKVPGLLAPELEVLTSLEGDFAQATCDQDDEELFHILDHSGDYLIELLVASGKDAVAEKVIRPAVKAILDVVIKEVPGAATYVSAWIADTAYDAAQSAISKCGSVCSGISAGAASIYRAMGWVGSKLGLTAMVSINASMTAGSGLRFAEVRQSAAGRRPGP